MLTTQVTVRLEVSDEIKTLTMAEIKKMAGAGGREASLLPLREELVGGGVADMTNLNCLNEPSILYNLRLRFLASHPYTYTAGICIAVNPYQWLDLYSDERKKVRA